MRLPDLDDAGAAPLQVLCLGAHCDDVEIGCGGTLLTWLARARAIDVRWVTFAGTPEREAETRAAAASLLAGAHSSRVQVHRFRESYFPWVGAEVKDAFEAIKRDCHPDVVFTHRRDDLHQDHRTVSELTWNTFRDHLVLEYEIPKFDADLGQPNLFVPLTAEALARKVDILLASFPSQRHRPWFDADTFRALPRLRGVECNAPFAEAFHLRKLTT